MQSDCLFSSLFFNPLRPAQATIVAGTFLAIARQPLELESYSNPLRIQQVFWFKSKKTFFVFGGGFAGGTATSGGGLEISTTFGQPWAPTYWPILLTQSFIEN